ncbi:MAG: DNA alkylation repair protein [Bacteroidia bacterium]
MKTEQWSIDWVHKARACMAANENPMNSVAMKSYMKDNFLFYGIPKPQRALLAKDFFINYGVPNENQFRSVVHLLWDEPYRELHYLAMDILYRNRKHFQAEDIFLFEELMRTHSWWDSIDYISPTLCFNLFAKFPHIKESTLKRWNLESDFWIRRASIIAQLKEKDKIDRQLQLNLISTQLNEKEFFIRKAIGWSLREMAKTYPETVLRFANSNHLSKLSRKEALKYIVLVD